MNELRNEEMELVNDETTIEVIDEVNEEVCDYEEVSKPSKLKTVIGLGLLAGAGTGLVFLGKRVIVPGCKGFIKGVKEAWAKPSEESENTYVAVDAETGEEVGDIIDEEETKE